MACPRNRELALLARQRLARGDAQLPFHEVEAGDHLRDRMLDLQPRVHFHEIERAVRCDDEFHGAGAAVVDGARGSDRGLAHLAAAFGRHARRGRLFDDLLVPALHRAIALEQIDGIAVVVAEHLHFDVPRAASGISRPARGRP